jgi:hypothetical protein
MIHKALVLSLSLLFSMSCLAQKKAESPRDSCSGKIGTANVVISYSSPSVKGRKIWGALVPFGNVWRSGANEATTFKTDKDINVEGKLLKAGTYGFFTIPGESSWTIIFNKTSKQWGAFKYAMTEDALRVEVKSKKADAFTEHLVYKITNSGFSLIWENLEVPVGVK